MRALILVLTGVLLISGLGLTASQIGRSHSGSGLGLHPDGVSPAISSLTVSAAFASGSTTPTWTQLTTTTQPSNRDQVAMAYDPALTKVVLFGGYDPNVRPLGDTWYFHAGAWHHVTFGGAPVPAPRWAAGFAYDPDLRGMLLFGGRDLGRFFHDTWLLNGTGWHNLTGHYSPSARSGVAMAYDPIDGYMVLFGGGRGNVPAGSGSAWTYYNDTWGFSGGSWTSLTSSVTSAPPPTFAMQATFDPASHYVLFEGGSRLMSGVGVSQSWTWSYVGGHWSKLTTKGAPGPWYAPRIAWDRQFNSAILIGENTSSSFDPTYKYRFGIWTNISPVSTPTPATRGNVGLAYDLVDGYLVLFGGDTPPPNYSYRADTWVFK